MTQFVHLTDSKSIKLIEKTGIGIAATRIDGVRGFYCTPVSRSYYKTHQWLRELKRTGVKSIHAVQFTLPSDQKVYIGRYNSEHMLVTASEAAAIFESHNDAMGLEVIVTARVPPRLVKKIYVPAQVIGWRYYPEAKGKKPFCGCKVCNRGEMNAYRVITETA